MGSDSRLVYGGCWASCERVRAFSQGSGAGWFNWRTGDDGIASDARVSWSVSLVGNLAAYNARAELAAREKRMESFIIDGWYAMRFAGGQDEWECDIDVYNRESFSESWADPRLYVPLVWCGWKLPWTTCKILMLSADQQPWSEMKPTGSPVVLREFTRRCPGSLTQPL